MAVSEVRHTAVTNSKNSVFRIAFIDKDVFNVTHCIVKFNVYSLKFKDSSKFKLVRAMAQGTDEP